MKDLASASQDAARRAPTPSCCQRPMLAVEDSATGKPIWWCADCHRKANRFVKEQNA